MFKDRTESYRQALCSPTLCFTALVEAPECKKEFPPGGLIYIRPLAPLADVSCEVVYRALSE